jgi:hypothetical protein
LENTGQAGTPANADGRNVFEPGFIDRNLANQAAVCLLASSGQGGLAMFIAMNRFRVAKGSEAAFEQVWLSRDSHLDKVPGFVEFHLLRGPEAEDHTLYASHTIWENRAVF